MRRLILPFVFLFISSCATVQTDNELAYPTPITHTTEHSVPLSNPSKEQISSELGLAFDKSEWTDKERLAFALSLLANAADLYTSLNDDGTCVESTPLLGKNPSDGLLISVKLIAIGFEYWLYNNPKFHTGTHWYGFTSAVYHGITAYTNSQNDCFKNR